MDPLIALAALVFEHDAGTLGDSDNPDTVATWDSLTHIVLITAVEDEWGVSFDSDEILDMKSIGDLRAQLQAKGVTL